MSGRTPESYRHTEATIAKAEEEINFAFCRRLPLAA